MSKLYVHTGHGHTGRRRYSRYDRRPAKWPWIVGIAAAAAVVILAVVLFILRPQWQHKAESSSVPAGSTVSSAPVSTVEESTAPSSEEASSAVGSKVDYIAMYPELYTPKVPIVERVEGDKVVFLTFNEGPSTQTEALLEVLRKEKVPATFFVSGVMADNAKRKELLKKIDADGHAIGIYSYSADYSVAYKSVETYLQEFLAMDDCIFEATGKHAVLFRFPAGSGETAYNREAGTFTDIAVEMTRRGFVYHDWNVDAGDYGGTSAEKIAQTVLDGCKGKEKCVVSLGNAASNARTVEAAKLFIAELKKEGYRFAKLDPTVRPFQFAGVEAGS